MNAVYNHNQDHHWLSVDGMSVVRLNAPAGGSLCMNCGVKFVCLSALHLAAEVYCLWVYCRWLNLAAKMYCLWV